MAALPAALYAFCNLRGLSAERLHKEWGLPVGGYPDIDTFVPYREGLALWDALTSASPKHPVGVEFGEFLGGMELGVVGLASAQARTLGEAVDIFGALQQVVDPRLVVTLQHDARGAAVVFEADSRLTDRCHPLEGMLVSAHRTAQRLCDAPLLAERLEFAHEPCAAATAYREIFGCVPTRSHRYAIVYSSEVLGHALPDARPELAKYLWQQAHSIGQLRGTETPSVRETLSAWIEEQLRGHERDFAAVELEVLTESAARSLGKSRRTLQRELQAAGTTFRKELEAAQRRRAEQLLAGTKLAIFEIAFLLGYREPRGFQRAFKRWAGITPTEFRVRGCA